MAKKYNNIIETGAGFKYTGAQPLDDRDVVEQLADLTALDESNLSYEGQDVYVTAKGASFKKIGDNWVQTATIEDVEYLEQSLPDIIAGQTTAAMEFKGATASLPTTGTNGDMYKVSGSFEVSDTQDAQGKGFTTQVGDSIVCDKDGKWYLIPSGDDIEDTWRAITGVDNDATLTFAAGDKLDVAVAANGTITYSHEAINAPKLIAENEQTRTYITEVETDGFGHITGYKTATEDVEDTNTTYTFEGLPMDEGEGGNQTAPSSVYFQVTASEEGATAEVIYVDAYTRNEADGKFVAKETGKQLSTEDFTTTLLNKLNGIEENANNYEHPTYTVHNEGLYKVTVDAKGHVSDATAVTSADIADLGVVITDTVYEHPVFSDVETDISSLYNITISNEGHIVTREEVTTEQLHNRIGLADDDKNGLITKEDFAKLGGISVGANKVEASTTNGKIKIDGVEEPVYDHPEYTSAALGFYKVAVDKNGHVSDVTSVSKNDIVALGIPAQDTTYATATADADGLMSKYHFSKVEGISEGATKVENVGGGKIKINDQEVTVYEHPDKHAIADVEGLQDAINSKVDQSVVDAMYTNGQIDTAVQGAKDYAKGLVDAIPEQTNYTVSIEEDTTDSTIAKRYIFKQLGEEIGRIDLAKELVVTSGSVKEVTTADTPYSGAKVGDKYIELVIANQDAPIYVPAKDLVDIYTAASGATEVQVAISNTNEISATLVNGGITEEKLAEAVKTKLNKTWEEIGVAASLVEALENGQVKTNKEAIETLNSDDTTEGSVAHSIKTAIDTANLGQYAKTEDLGYLATLDTITANKVTDFATEVAKVKVNDASKADEATCDGEGRVIVDTYLTKDALPLAKGTGEGSLVINEGDATGSHSIAGGTTDKTVISNILGNLASASVTVERPQANAVGGMSLGSGTKTLSAAGTAIGVMNTAGVKGLYWESISKVTDSNSEHYGKYQIILSNTQDTIGSIYASKDAFQDAVNKNSLTDISQYGWSDGDTISIVNSDKYPACATIVDIISVTCSYTSRVILSEQTLTADRVALIVSTLPFSSRKDVTLKLPDDYSIFACYQKEEVNYLDRIVNKRWYPRDGVVELGWAATAIGIENLVSGSAGFAAGWNNWAAGDYGFVSGKNNIAGYAARAGGSNARALGQLSVAEGGDVEATGYAAVATGNVTKASGWASQAVNTNTEARGNASFACGRGTVAYAPDILACGSYNNWEQEWDWNKTWEDQKYTAKFVVGRGEKGARANCFVAGIDNTIEGKPSYIRVGGNKLISNQVGTLATMADNEASENPYARVNDIPSLAPYAKTADLPISQSAWSTSLILKNSDSGALGEYSCALGYNVISNPDIDGQFVCGSYNNPNYSTTNPSTSAQFIVGAGTSATDMKNCFAAGYKSGTGSYMYLGDQMLNAATLKTWLNSINNLRISAKDLVVYSGQSYTVVKEKPPLENDWNAIDRDISNELRKSTVKVFYIDDPSSFEIKTWTFDISDNDAFYTSTYNEYYYFNENSDMAISDVKYKCYFDAIDSNPDNVELIVEAFGRTYSMPIDSSIYVCRLLGASLTIHNVESAIIKS